MPQGQKATYLELLINRIFKQAIQNGDQQMIKKIWNYIDGLPKQSTDITSDGKSINPVLVKFIKDKIDGDTNTDWV